MTDSQLRQLERRWKETQSVEDEAAYLLERVRVGDLEREKLELAAYLGDQASRDALGEEAVSPDDTVPLHHGLGLALKRVQRAPHLRKPLRLEFVWRACLAAVHEASVEWTNEFEARAGNLRIMDPGYVGTYDGRQGPVWDRFRQAKAAIVGNHDTLPDHSAAYTLILDSEDHASFDRVWRAIGFELVVWALGYRDPLRERVEARQKAAE